MSKDGLVVRKATLDDILFCASLPGSYSAVLLEKRIAAQEVLIAVSADERAGFLIFDFMWGTLPFLDKIIVHMNFRGQGVGRALLAGFEDRLRKGGFNRILSSSQSNEALPQAWHLKCGFVQTGILSRINDDGSDEIFFLKTFS